MFTLQNNIDKEAKLYIKKNGLSILYKNDIYDEKSQILDGLVKTCNDKITSGYIENAFENIIRKHDDYDIVVVVKNSKIVGFIITHIGACKYDKFKTIPVLSLVCSSLSIGKLLMYLYVNSLIKNNIRYGILELANGYKNKKGFCLYKKFGFNEHIELSKGFRSTHYMIPMILDVSAIKPHIINISFKNKTIFQVDPLCNDMSKTYDTISDEISMEKNDIINKILEKSKLKLDSLSLIELQKELDNSMLDVDYPRFPSRSKTNTMKLYDVRKSSKATRRKK